MKAEKVFVIRDAAIAAKLARPKQPVWETPPQQPCETCGRAVEERIITTGSPTGDPAVWNAVPVAVDGWICAKCGLLRYPRPATPERITSFGVEGAEHGRAGRFAEAEWWFTRMLWAWPDYAPGYMDLAQTLLGRADTEKNLEPAMKRRLEHRARDAYEAAVDLETRQPSEGAVALLSRAHLALAELALGERAAERAQRSIDACLALAGLDEAALTRAQELDAYVADRWWVYADAIAVLSPFLNLQDRKGESISDPSTRQRVAQAVDELEALHETVASKWQPIWGAAMGASALGQKKRTLDLWRRASRAHPGVAEIAREHGGELLRQNLTEEARDLMRGATERLPDDATLWCNRGVTELLAGNLAEARRCAAKSQKMNPEDPIARALVGKLAQLREGELPRTWDELNGR